MMAHCSAALEMASGKVVARRTLLGVTSPAEEWTLLIDDSFARLRASGLRRPTVDRSPAVWFNRAPVELACFSEA